MQSVWGKNNGKWASYQIQQNQNRTIYSDYAIQQERISQGCQTINKTANVAAINSGSVLTALKEGSQDYTCTEKAECLIKSSCPAKIETPPPPPPPYVPSPGEATWANIFTTSSPSATQSMVVRGTTTDSDGNVYVCGTFLDSSTTTFPIYNYVKTENGQIVLEPSSITINTTGTPSSNKAFLVKYNSDGIALWASYMDGEETIGQSVVTDNAGNVYFILRQNILTFLRNSIYTIDVSGNTSLYGTINTNLYVSTSFDIIIIKYNSSGIAQYVSACISSRTEGLQNNVVSIAIDSAGFIIYYFSTIGAQSSSLSPLSICNGIQPSTPGGTILFDTSTLFGTLTLPSAGTAILNTFGVLVRANTTTLAVQEVTRINVSSSNAISSVLYTITPLSVCVNSSGNIIISGNASVNLLSNNNIITINKYDNNTGGIISVSNWGTLTISGPLNANTSDTFIIIFDNTLTPIALSSITSTNFATSKSSRNVSVDTNGDIYTLTNINQSGVPIIINSYLSGVGSGGTILVSQYGNITGFSPSTLLIKYNSSLVVQSITTIEQTLVGVFNTLAAPTPFGLVIDSLGNIYCGLTFQGGAISIRNLATLSGGSLISGTQFAKVMNITPVNSSPQNDNIVLVKYNSSFQAQWATTLNCGPQTAANGSCLALDNTNTNLYIVGLFINYNGNLNIFDYDSVSNGNLITTQNAILVPNAIAQSTSQTSGFIVKYAC
jgi:hypothetical protein